MPGKPIFDPNLMGRTMRVAAFMSGSGSNITKLIEKERELKEKEGTSPFSVIFIFSDRSDGGCHGESIACNAGIPYISYDIRTFHKRKSVKRSVLTPEGLAARNEYDGIAKDLVKTFDIDVIALGGYMSYITLNRCVNVHPADLSILTDDGKRKYVGDQAVLDAIINGEKELRASTLWTDEGVDTGPLMMISEPVQVELPEPLDSLINKKERLLSIADEHQERLKEQGDWKIFPRTIELIARGSLAIEEGGCVYLDGKPMVQGKN